MLSSIESTSKWLKTVFVRLDEDIHELHRVESFWHACLKCSDGHCCSQESYFASANVGNPFAAVEWWIALEYVRDCFTPDDRKQLVRNISSNRKACVFLFGNRCKVYPNRSWISRIHPYTISFYPGQYTLPEGEVALPSCPKYAPAFDIKVNELRVQRPRIVARSDDNRLVQLQLRKHKPVWFIDATRYVAEYESYLAERRTTAAGSPWEDLLRLAEDAGKEYGELLKAYLAQTLGIG